MRRILFASLAVASGWACAGDRLTQSDGDPSGPEMTDQSALMQLRQGMEASGCRVAPPRSAGNEVTVPLPDGTAASFDCTGVQRDKIRKAVIAFRATIDPGLDGSMPAATTWYIDVVVYFSCQVTHHYFPVMGEMVYAWTTVDGCWITEIVGDFGGGGGGSGGGTWYDENNNPVSPPSLPYSPPVVADTVCHQTTEDRVIMLPVLKPGGAIVAGALNDRAMQDSLRAALIDSYGTIENPLPQAQRYEIGGAIYMNHDDSYSFVRLQSLPGTQSICSFQAAVPVNSSLVAVWHTHVVRDGEEYVCPAEGPQVQTANTEGRGGGSDWDWAAADTFKVPMYTIDPDRMWRLNPKTDPGPARTGNPNRWTRGTSGSCAAAAPF